MKNMNIKYMEVPCEVENCRAFVYRIPRNEDTNKVMKSEAVPCRNITDTTFDIPGTTAFLRKFNVALRNITKEYAVLVDCTNGR